MIQFTNSSYCDTLLTYTPTRFTFTFNVPTEHSMLYSGTYNQRETMGPMIFSLVEWLSLSWRSLIWGSTAHAQFSPINILPPLCLQRAPKLRATHLVAPPPRSLGAPGPLSAHPGHPPQANAGPPHQGSAGDPPQVRERHLHLRVEVRRRKGSGQWGLCVAGHHKSLLKPVLCIAGHHKSLH